MKTFIRLLLISFLAYGIVIAQNEDELQIPEEQDDQYAPEDQAVTVDLREGSGAGILIEHDDKTETTIAPLEDIESRVLKDNIDSTTFAGDTDSCPSPCVCNTQAEEFVVDCSGYEISVFPTNLDPRTTILNINNNKLLEIPNTVSSLKNLKVLNAHNNQIMELLPGSVSELPELLKLKLGNNRLLEYPQDLKNAFYLTKLQEIDLGGNDIRSTLTSELFSNFKQLKNVTLPISTPELLQDLCRTLKDSLEKVCVGNCSENFYECPDAPEDIDEGLIIATTPASAVTLDEFNDPVLDVDVEEKEITNIKVNETTTANPQLSVNDAKEEIQKLGIAPLAAFITPAKEETGERPAATGDEPSLGAEDQTTVKSVDKSAIKASDELPTKAADDTTVKVGATTTDTQTGGVDKSIIGLVIAGMIVIIAGITLSKNWSSIKKRFSSTPRSPERAANGVNGNQHQQEPEEVPLQDKSPV